ncbi:MAG: phosphoribosylformylglycinamidine synthase subunit PurL [Candidatus Hecatellales archaeon]|nr:MAG: phosphoribosylformylglycinamidine synthase subunit PurL [Candidatus Hecatellales archaeon]
MGRTKAIPVKVNLSKKEIRVIRRLMGREPTLEEWGMFDIMWSEHCSYKSSRPILKKLPTSSPRVVVGPGYDSGIVDVGDGYVVAFKVESHNHPSAIEPYNGAATGIGGIVRDVLAIGARPILLIDPLRFGRLESSRTKWLFRYVVKGIGDYGNCIGVPTVAGEVEFDESFETNCLVNVACYGVAKKDKIFLARFDNPGDILILIGGSTGRDGIHGVTFASKTIGEKSEEDRPAVQIGDPFTKKLLIETVLEILETGYVHGIKDLGGGGLTCATSEMAAKGGTGVEIELDKVHVREEGMTPYELLLSESQERMLLAVDPKGVDEVKKILEKYEIPYSIIGRVTDTGLLVAKFNGKVVASIPPKYLAETPVVRRKAKKPSYLRKVLKVKKPREPKNLSETVYRLLEAPNIACKEWVYRQYDHEVGVRTVLKPGEADAAVLRILETGRGIAVKADCNSRHSYLDPFNGSAGALAEAVRNVVCVGGEPLAYTDCCNFGNPENPEVFWQFKRGVEGLAYMSRALGVPCVGGNVSFYNEDENTRVAVKPSIVVVMLGLVENLEWVTTMAFKGYGEPIVLVGKTYPELGGSEYYHEIHGLTGGKPPKADGKKEKATVKTVMEAIRNGFVTSAHDCSKGGLAIALALMAIKGKMGVKVDLSKVPSSKPIRMDELLFSESYARIVLTAPNLDSAKKILKIAGKNGAPANIIGETVDDDRFTLMMGLKKTVECSVSLMEKVWRETIPKAMGEEAE